ncbi:hypothetical protein SAMN05443572_106475 [Myxococcus fulvus]|uniref:Uncharacterized protein n=1 Tax=Myxococcus fulvus TaxID=33 RepID=A0A511T3A2_MYXFU|nr:hypothetical protein MFU01_31400 [Myxococcus fulvus]SEU22986.1 hypothetical protein SAMN05443572_106475 [Myxococcus fulvus]
MYDFLWMMFVVAPSVPRAPSPKRAPRAVLSERTRQGSREAPPSPPVRRARRPVGKTRRPRDPAAR